MYDSSNKSHKKIHLEWSLSMARIDFGSILNQYKQKQTQKQRYFGLYTNRKLLDWWLWLFFE